MKLFGTFLAASFAAPAVYDYSSQGSNWANGVCASGQGQSPIDIDESTTTPVSTEYDQFTLTNYEKPHKWNVKNTGHGVKLEPAVEDMKFTGGDFSEEYTLAQFHFHWGDYRYGKSAKSKFGSEHTFNGKRYFSEVHFVHYKSSHADLSAAVASGAQDDLAVLGFFLEIDYLVAEGPFDYLITDIIADKVNTYNNVTETKETVFWSPNHLVDVENIKTAPFYRYEGGLTTPTCDEIVTWTVFKDAIKITPRTAMKMTYFANDDTGFILNNFRETQPLNGREVKYYDGTTAQDPNAPVVAPVVAEKKSKVDTKVAFGMLPVSAKNPFTGAVETIMKPVQKILMCFTGSDLCMFQ